MRAYSLLPLLLCAGSASLAHAQMPTQDTVKGGKDHPLLSRFEGSKMVGYGIKEFDEVMLPSGKRVENKGGQMAFDSALQLEGTLASPTTIRRSARRWK